MIVKLNGEELEVAEGLTFAELIAYVRSLLDHQVLVELRLNGETASQALLDELKGQPISGGIELLSLSSRDLGRETVRQGLLYLEQFERVEGEPEGVPGLLEGFAWLNQALALILLEVDFPELQMQIGRLLTGNRRLRERLSRSSPQGLEGLREELRKEFAAYQDIFGEIGKRLERCGGDIRFSAGS
jgi:sulfur carrier protein ThiS